MWVSSPDGFLALSVKDAENRIPRGAAGGRPHSLAFFFSGTNERSSAATGNGCIQLVQMERRGPQALPLPAIHEAIQIEGTFELLNTQTTQAQRFKATYET